MRHKQGETVRASQASPHVREQNVVSDGRWTLSQRSDVVNRSPVAKAVVTT
jgi:hypothetical protein